MLKYMVVDDFYTNPDIIREQALKLDYKVPTDKLGYTGLQAQTWQNKQDYLQRLKTVMLNPHITCPDRWNGVFRMNTEKSETTGNAMVHTDINELTAVVYLGKEKYDGTTFYRTKEHGFRSLSEMNASVKTREGALELLAELKQNYRNPDYWILDEAVAYKYNRLVVINGDFFHAPGIVGEQFLTSQEPGGRLIQVSFLNLPVSIKHMQ